MRKTFQKMIQSLPSKKIEDFIDYSWGQLFTLEHGQKWKFCPLTTAAIELGLNRRNVINALKKDVKLARKIIYDYMESLGYSANKLTIFTLIWDSWKARTTKDRLEFAALMADTYDIDISFDEPEEKLHEKFNNDLMPKAKRTVAIKEAKHILDKQPFHALMHP